MIDLACRVTVEVRKLLKSHMDARERSLLVISNIPANSGHSLHKGTPREAFIREFLQGHLPDSVAIGTGEIIDAGSKPNEQRNQYDIIVYRRDYPKLDFGGGISGFLVESVIATIEVKSTLTKADTEQAIGAAINAKRLTPNTVESFSAGYTPPKVLNYVIAYDGPADMKTVSGWVTSIHAAKGISIADLPLDEAARQQTPAPSLDGIFVLGKGFLYFDNTPMGFGGATRQHLPQQKWVLANQPDGNLLLLFMFLTTATQNLQGKWLNSLPYLSGYQARDASFLS